ncbi:MAG TPA: ATP-binding protein [Gemmatimonadaceae bacterium]|jgi:two-component system sensor histidine kinase GlrK
MKVGTRLRSAFAIYIALLAGVVVYHVRTIQRTVESGHVLTEISSRLRVSSTAQLGRLSQMSSDAEKFLVTRDAGYLNRVVETSHAYGASLHALDSVPLTEAERAAVIPLDRDWKNVESRVEHIATVEQSSSDGDTRAFITQLQTSLDQVRDETRDLAAASQDAMTRELASSEDAARTAEHLSWAAALGALILSVLLSALLVRSIVDPLDKLAEGTREVSAGRFGYRLDTTGGDEFSQVARDFNSMTERLDELDRMKRDFVAKVSHDLKTPLSSMQETIRVLLDEVTGPLAPKQRQLLELNLDGGRRLSNMLSKLLDLSRIEAGLEPDLQMLDVMQLVKRSMERADSARTERAYHLSLVEPEHRLLVRGDATGLAQVLDNLLENAIKFSPPGGTVQVRVAEWPSGGDRIPPERVAVMRRSGMRGGAVLLTVSDEGPGIPDEEKERVFTRFYQAEAGRAARGRGVGLGLTICQEIVAAHGGTIWVADNDPRGSIFCVLLPGAVCAPDNSLVPATAPAIGVRESAS